jgi:hypothetical protein
MSEENVEIVRRIYEEGLIYRDPEGLVAELGTPDSNTSIRPTRSNPELAAALPRWRRLCGEPTSRLPRLDTSFTGWSTRAMRWSPSSPLRPWPRQRERGRPGRGAHLDPAGRQDRALRVGSRSGSGPESRRAFGVAALDEKRLSALHGKRHYGVAPLLFGQWSSRSAEPVGHASEAEPCRASTLSRSGQRTRRSRGEAPMRWTSPCLRRRARSGTL